MKKHIYLILILTSLLSCNSNDETSEFEQDSFTGEWKLTEAFISSGGPQYWVDIKNGEKLVFFKNKTFKSNKYSKCKSGNFSIEIDTLNLEYTCDGFQTNAENQAGLITYIIDFKSNYFILTPTSGPICIEGCSYKYQRQ